MLAEAGTAVNRGAYSSSCRRMQRFVSHFGPASGIQSVRAPSVQATAVARDAPWGEVKGVFYDHRIPEALRRLLKDAAPEI
jgi:hypothetical protein